MSIINQPTIYNTPTIYNGGGGGGGGGGGAYKPSIYKDAGIYKAGGELKEIVIGGKTYPVVKIGNLYWTAQNIEYVDNNILLGGIPTYDYNNSHAWYYNNDENEFGWNGKKFGLLYNNLAVEYLEANKDTLLNGFRVPTELDFQHLEESVGVFDFIKKLKSTDFWNTPGTNESGFTMVPGGSCSGDNNTPVVWSDVYIQSNLRMITSDHLGKQFRANDDNSYVLLRGANESFGISLRLCKEA